MWLRSTTTAVIPNLGKKCASNLFLFFIFQEGKSVTRWMHWHHGKYPLTNQQEATVTTWTELYKGRQANSWWDLVSKSGTKKACQPRWWNNRNNVRQTPTKHEKWDELSEGTPIFCPEVLSACKAFVGMFVACVLHVIKDVLTQMSVLLRMSQHWHGRYRPAVRILSIPSWSQHAYDC